MYTELKTIWVTFRREGIHRYPDAATRPELEDVSYLAHPHRHMFHFRVEVDVSHNNRQIEFIQFKHYIENLYSEEILQLDYKSCEMICQDIIAKVLDRYSTVNVITVSVSEDGENGATVTGRR